MPYHTIRYASTLLALAALVACREATGPRPGSGNPEANDACTNDDVAPMVTRIGASPSRLWPPDHDMVPIDVQLDATDECSAVTSSIVSVTSSEPDNALGDGNTTQDWRVTGPLSVLLRAERSGTGSGRTYAITVRSVDAAGNATTSTTSVLVPHDNGGGSRP
jgi:hypothetical protein